MNIDCIADHLKIYSRCFQNMKNYILGSQKFLDSIRTITVLYKEKDSKPDLEADFECIKEYFKNIN